MAKDDFAFRNNVVGKEAFEDRRHEVMVGKAHELVERYVRNRTGGNAPLGSGVEYTKPAYKLKSIYPLRNKDK